MLRCKAELHRVAVVWLRLGSKLCSKVADSCNLCCDWRQRVVAASARLVHIKL